MIKRMIMLVVAALFAMSVMVPAALAAPLPDNCTKDQGTVTCTTFEGPGNNQAGVGETTATETQGNTKNKSPEEPQNLEDTSGCNPALVQREALQPVGVAWRGGDKGVCARTPPASLLTSRRARPRAY